MSEEPNTAAEQPAPSSDNAPARSTQGVLVVLGLILLVPILALIFAFRPHSGGAGADLVDSIDTDKVQAVYLTTDLVYFGTVEDAHGDFFELDDAFYLRSTSSGDKDTKDAAQLVPVPVSDEVGGDGNLRINAREVVRIQALEKDSEIAKAIDVND